MFSRGEGEGGMEGREEGRGKRGGNGKGGRVTTCVMSTTCKKRQGLRPNEGAVQGNNCQGCGCVFIHRVGGCAYTRMWVVAGVRMGNDGSVHSELDLLPLFEEVGDLETLGKAAGFLVLDALRTSQLCEGQWCTAM